MSVDRLRIAFLIGRDDAGTQALISKVCSLEGVEVAAVLLDTGREGASQRRRNLKRNVRREGISYLFFRAISALRSKLEDWAARVIPQAEVEELLRAAFPDRGLDRLAQRYGFRLFEAGDLNGAHAIEFLRPVNADLGVVLGTRVLKRALFSIPRMGCINLHKGTVPEYRGMPPGFWELYDGCDSAGVTIHFVDDGLDTGDVVGTSEVPIHSKETPESLRAKLDAEGGRLLVATIEQLQQGIAERRVQPKGGYKPRTRPTRAQIRELARRLPHWRRLGDGRQAIKTALWLLLFHTGVYGLVHRTRRESRGAILLYHRVNDVSDDVLTANTRRFAEHLVTLKHYYRPVATSELVEKVAGGERIEPTSVAIHFDDCYRDVRSCATPLLAAAGVPAVAFVSSGFVDTGRVFEHDRAKYPHAFENLHSQELQEMPELGVQIGAHTVNHVDLGSVSLEQARLEVEESRQQLEQILARPVLLFSFPFGKFQNMREEVREMVRAAGYQGLFSAYGGFLGPQTSLFDIPRMGVSSDHSPLALLMELEGISQAHLKHWLRMRRL